MAHGHGVGAWGGVGVAQGWRRGGAGVAMGVAQPAMQHFMQHSGWWELPWARPRGPVVRKLELRNTPPRVWSKENSAHAARKLALEGLQ